MSMLKANNSTGFIVAAVRPVDVNIIKPVCWVKKKAKILGSEAYRFGVTSYKHAMTYKIPAGTIFSHIFHAKHPQP